MKQLLIISFLMLSGLAFGQRFAVNEISKAYGLHNPASFGANNQFELQMKNNVQRFSGTHRFNSSYAHLGAVIPSKKKGIPLAGIGLFGAWDTQIKEKTYQFYHVGLAYAQHVYLGKENFLSLGVQATYSSRQIGVGSLTTGSQWMHGFHGELSNGEAVERFSSSYFNVGAGLRWFMRDKNGLLKSEVSLSADQLSRPIESIYNDFRLPIKYQFYSSIRVYTAKHVEADIWRVLKTEASLAFEQWKTNNPNVFPDDKEFFMIGEVMHLGLNNFKDTAKGTRKYDYGA